MRRGRGARLAAMLALVVNLLRAGLLLIGVLPA
jgi:hypothetical protein